MFFDCDMELFCAEKIQDSQLAGRDPVIFEDMRVLQNLLDTEAQFIPSCNYFESVQTDVQPFMRKVVTTWMLEVCEEQMCEDQVFPLAVNFLDRFLCVCVISRRQLQLAGAVCLLLASKIRQCHALSVDLLCAYTDHSIAPVEMKSWELLVLSKLRWDVTAVTGYDVAEHVLARLPQPLHPLTRQHALTLVGFCYIEPEFIQSPPSLLAAAAICAAVRGLHQSAGARALAAALALTRADPQAAERVMQHIEHSLAAELANQQQQQQQPQPQPAKTPLPLGPPAIMSASASAPAASVMPAIAAKAVGVAAAPSDLEDARQPETPTDVQDVHF